MIWFTFFITISLSQALDESKIEWPGRWGYWAEEAIYCWYPGFVCGIRVRIEDQQGDGDDTALNSIELYCCPPNYDPYHPNPNRRYIRIKSDYQRWGRWHGPKFCHGANNPVVGFEVREEGRQEGGDDSALNAVRLYCKDGQPILNHHGFWGDWYPKKEDPKKECPKGTAVNGFQTRVEHSLGGDEDDTALNGFVLFCNKYP